MATTTGNDTPGRLLTLQEIAEVLQVSLTSVYNWIHDGKLPVTRVGREWRMRQSDLDAWLDSQEKAGVSA